MIARRLIASALLTAVIAPPLAAHAIHTTMSVISTDAQGTTMMVRAFADDFAASIAAATGKPLRSDWLVDEADAMAYARTRLRLADPQGRAVPLTSCGLRRERELYWLCIRVARPAGVDGLQLTNLLLTERHPDQVNIVQWVRGASRTTLLCTKASPSSVLR